jgi:hypothetical protein
MSTVTVTYQYVYFQGGLGHTRQPRSTTGPAGLTLLSQFPGPPVETGGSFRAPLPPAPYVVGNLTYDFAFTNVSGAIPAGQTTPGGLNWFSSSTFTPTETVGTTPIVVLTVYVPTGGGGIPGASIDSFNSTTGQLFSDTFVSVSPDPGGPPPPLTTEGNVDGWVPTTTATETITALSPTSPSSVIFEQWKNLYSEATAGVTMAGTELTVNKGASVYAFAFYNVDPCAALRAELANLSPGDFPAGPAYAEARASLLKALVQCEESHGEIPQ